MFSEVEPDDLLRYGLIPELVGRLPVTVALEGLDEEALVRILKEPKNALTKQYAKLFGLEDVKITFDEAALVAIATKALKRGTGARPVQEQHRRAAPVVHQQVHPAVLVVVAGHAAHRCHTGPRR